MAERKDIKVKREGEVKVRSRKRWKGWVLILLIQLGLLFGAFVWGRAVGRQNETDALLKRRLFIALEDTRDDVRHQSVKSLGDMTEAGVPKLKAAMKDGSDSVRQAASKSLARIRRALDLDEDAPENDGQ